MKRRILAFLLLFTMIMPMFGQTFVFAEENADAPVWTANGTTVTEGENGFTTFPVFSMKM